MHSGRVSSPEDIRFDPNPFDPCTVAALGDRRANAPRLFVGPSFWGVPGWVGARQISRGAPRSPANVPWREKGALRRLPVRIRRPPRVYGA